MLELLGLGIFLEMRENITDKSRDVNGAFQEMEESARKMVDRVDHEMQRFENIIISGFALNRIGDGFNKFGGKILSTFYSAGKAVTYATSKYETYRATLNGLYRDTEKADKMLSWAVKLGKETPFETTDVIESLIGLKSVGVEANKQYKGLNGEMRSLLEYIGDLGALRPDVGMKGVLFAFRNLIGGSDISLKRRLDISPKQILGRKIDYSSNESIIKDFITISQTLAKGLMTSLQGTWVQLLSNLEDYKMDFLRSIGESGFFNKVKSTLENLMGMINDIDFVKLGKNISDILSTLYKPVDLLARAIFKVVRGVFDFAEKYPTIAKIFGVFVAGVAVTSLLAGTIFKVAGNTLILVSTLGSLIVQFQLLRYLGASVNSQLFATVNMLGRIAKASMLVFGGLSIAFFMWQQNLFGFRDVLSSTIDMIERSPLFNKIQALVEVFGALFFNDRGDSVFFSDTLVDKLKSLDMWDFAKSLVMLKGRVEGLFKGIVIGIGDILNSTKKFVLSFIKPILGGGSKTINTLNNLLSIITREKIKNFEDLGIAIGKVIGVLITAKLAKSALLFSKSLLTITGSFLFSNKLKLLGLIVGIALFKKFIDNGGRMYDITNGLNRAFSKLRTTFMPVAMIFNDFMNDVSRYGLIDSMSVALNRLGNWFDNGGKESLTSLWRDICNFFTNRFNDLNILMSNWWENSGRVTVKNIVYKIGDIIGSIINTVFKIPLSLGGFGDVEIKKSDIWVNAGVDIGSSFLEGFLISFNPTEIADTIVRGINNIDVGKLLTDRGSTGLLFTLTSTYLGYKVGGYKGAASAYAFNQARYLGDDQSNWRDIIAIGGGTVGLNILLKSIFRGSGGLAGLIGGGLMGLGLGGAAATIGTGGVFGSAAGIVSGIIDLVAAFKSKDKENKNNKLWSAGTKIGLTATGAGLGALIGSVVPILGTALGGLIGGGIGGLIALFKGGELSVKIKELASSFSTVFSESLDAVGQFIGKKLEWLKAKITFWTKDDDEAYDYKYNHARIDYSTLPSWAAPPTLGNNIVINPLSQPTMSTPTKAPLPSIISSVGSSKNQTKKSTNIINNNSVTNYKKESPVVSLLNLKPKISVPVMTAINIPPTKKDGSHLNGLSRVPYDNYVANLHEGEAVLTKSEAETWRGNKYSNTFISNRNSSDNPQVIDQSVNVEKIIIEIPVTGIGVDEAKKQAQYVLRELKNLGIDNKLRNLKYS